MKALLRSSIVVLVVFAGYSAFSANNVAFSGAGPATPTCLPMPGASLCNK